MMLYAVKTAKGENMYPDKPFEALNKHASASIQPFSTPIPSSSSRLRLRRR